MTEANIVFEGRKFDVERREFDANGHHHVYDIILHPGAAVILPVLGDGRLVLIHNYREAVGEELLEIPAGTLDDLEPAEACAARELAEETGYRADRLEPLVTFYSTPGILNERMYAFVASDLKPGPTAHEPSERIRTTTMTLDEAIEAIHDGRITDGKTIVTLLYYERFIRREGTER